MNKYFKLDKDKREIIIDKTKKYNVNVDILDLIIDLQQENKQLKEDKNKLRDYIVDQLEAYERGIEDYKRFGIEDYTKGMAVGFKKCLEILGDEE